MSPLGSKPPDSGGRNAEISHGLQFGLSALIGMAIGHWIDKRWGVAPWGLLGGLFLGSILGMYNLVRSLK